MTALAWPLVVLVLGLCAARIAWEVAISQRHTLSDVSEAMAAERARLDSLAGVVDTERDRRTQQEARIADLEQTRRTLRNRNGGKD